MQIKCYLIIFIHSKETFRQIVGIPMGTNWLFNITIVIGQCLIYRLMTDGQALFCFQSYHVLVSNI